MERRARISSLVQLLVVVAAPVAGGVVQAADGPAVANGGLAASRPERRLLEAAVRHGELGESVVLGTMLEHSLMGNFAIEELGSSLLAGTRPDLSRLDSQSERASAAPASWSRLRSEGERGPDTKLGETVASRMSLARPRIMSLSSGKELSMSVERRTAAANDVLPISREVLPLLVNAMPDHASFRLASSRLSHSAAVVGVRPAYLKPGEFR